VGKRYTKIIIDTEEVVVARSLRKPIIAWCPACQRETQNVTDIQAALICHVDQDTIQEWIRAGQLHVSDGPERGVVICLASLLHHR
jgi:hypothetical protein